MLNRLRLFLLVSALAVLAVPALSQNTDLKPLLAGTANVPLTLKLSDLNADWRRMSVGQPADINSMTRFYTAFLGGGPGDVYYTKGDTETVGTDQYLVAYHAPTQKFDVQSIFRSGNPQAPKPPKLTPETVLNLSLLNLHTISSLSDIRPFDMQQEIADSNSAGFIGDMMAAQNGGGQEPGARGPEVESESNLKQIGLAMMQYSQDNDEYLPPMRDAAVAKKALWPYVKSDQVFLNPMTKQPFLPNTSIAHRSLASFNSPANFVIYYEATPAPDNTRRVLFLDGHVKNIPEGAWPTLKAASHVPNTPTPSALPPGGTP